MSITVLSVASSWIVIRVARDLLCFAVQYLCVDCRVAAVCDCVKYSLHDASYCAHITGDLWTLRFGPTPELRVARHSSARACGPRHAWAAAGTGWLIVAWRCGAQGRARDAVQALRVECVWGLAVVGHTCAPRRRVQLNLIPDIEGAVALE